MEEPLDEEPTGVSRIRQSEDLAPTQVSHGNDQQLVPGKERGSHAVALDLDPPRCEAEEHETPAEATERSEPHPASPGRVPRPAGLVAGGSLVLDPRAVRLSQGPCPGREQ